MSVGRNFLYKKTLFADCGGFEGIRHLNGGDDDLLMAKMSTGKNTTISLDPTSFVESVPKTSWKDYFKQKHRHLSVGSEYGYPHKVALGVLNVTHLLYYVFVFYLFVFHYFAFPVLALLAFRSGYIFWTFYKSSKIVNINFLNPLEVLLLDFLYVTGYAFLGLVTIFYRSRVWK